MRFYDAKLWAIIAAAFTLLTIIIAYISFSMNDIESGVYRILVSSNKSSGHGSGFKVAEPGIVITNHHVINNAKDIKVVYFDGERLKTVAAERVWFSSDKDLAILRTIGPLPGAVMELADIGRSELGKTDHVTAVGFPGIVDQLALAIEQGLLDERSAEKISLDATFSSGTIQRLVPSIQRLVIQHSANINGGNSGGPLFDSCQRIIGVNTFGTKSTLNMLDIFEAMAGNGQLSVQDPGDLEFSVHISEVIKALQENELNYSVTPGSCWGNLDFYERSSLGLSMLAALGSVIISVLAFTSTRHGYSENTGETGIYSAAPSNFSREFNHVYLTQMDSGERIELLNSFDDLDNIDYVFGRIASEADIVINDASISRQHARIINNGSRFLIQDFGSTNGTFIDGTRTPKGVEAELSNGGTLTLGNVNFKFSIHSPEEIGQATDNRYFDKWFLSGVDQAGNTLQFTLFGKTAALMEGEINEICKIGRSSACDFIINDDSVSREHAAVGIDYSGQLSIIDLGSSNGTFVDDESVGTIPFPIRRSQRIVIGSIKMYVSNENKVRIT